MHASGTLPFDGHPREPREPQILQLTFLYLAWYDTLSDISMLEFGTTIASRNFETLLTNGGRPMSTGTTPSADRAPASLRRRLVSTAAVPATAIALMLCAPTDASAALITYYFTSNASLFFADGNLEKISGFLEFDTTTNSVGPLASIVLTGPGPEAGTYSTDPVGSAAGLQADSAGGAQYVEVSFGALLGGAYAPLFSGTWSTELPVSTTIGSVIPTGGVAVASEPATLPLLAAALGLFGFRRRVLQRDRSPRAG
jgi:hypothetical protein